MLEDDDAARGLSEMTAAQPTPPARSGAGSELAAAGVSGENHLTGFLCESLTCRDDGISI
jgi:hypothetical protein